MGFALMLAIPKGMCALNGVEGYVHIPSALSAAREPGQFHHRGLCCEPLGLATDPGMQGHDFRRREVQRRAVDAGAEDLATLFRVADEPEACSPDCGHHNAKSAAISTTVSSSVM